MKNRARDIFLLLLCLFCVIHTAGFNQETMQTVQADVEGETEEREDDEITGEAAMLDDTFREIVIEEGIVYEDNVIYEPDGEGTFTSGDAALDAEAIGKMILCVLEGGKAEGYRESFCDAVFFNEFQNQDWEQLDAGWTANSYYDCYYTYATEPKGYVGYTYYIYPDFQKMGVETAKAVVFRCAVSTENRKLGDTKLELYDMSLTEYCSAREWKGDRVAFIENGEIIEGGGLIEIPGQEAEKEKKYIYTYEDMGSEQLVDLLRKDLKTEDIEDGWSLRDEYDFYYIYENERDGAVHYKYYFYWDNLKIDYERALVTDAWISENGIEEMQNHWFLTRRHNRTKGLADTQIGGDKNMLSDIQPFLEVDWTDSEILMLGHAILPQDSAQGWEFAIADMDFDGKTEVLITFTANHCGDNSLYIYKQEEGNVLSYVDTIATPERYMLSGIDYKKISPYMDIELLDAYVNENQEYRYLSLDCSSFGGDIHGGIYTVVLYETTLESDGTPKELARIEYCGPEQREELFFQGEKVYEAGRLRDLLAGYMDGYIPMGITYKTVEKSFARDIMGLSEEEREKENQELWQALEALAGAEKEDMEAMITEESRVMDEQLERIANPYFPAKEHIALKVRANYYKSQKPIDEIVDAEIDRLRVYEKGGIYKLEIHIPTDTASFDFPVMVRYFYVKADEINLIWPFYQAEPNGKCIYFYDDDELLLQTFDTEEKLENKGQLEPVCREENIEEEEEYWFRSMKKEEDRITFYRREMNHSGDEMQKDLFVWEKGKGLVQFETGFGPGPMEVTITEICEVHNR